MQYTNTLGANQLFIHFTHLEWNASEEVAIFISFVKQFQTTGPEYAKLFLKSSLADRKVRNM